MKNIKISIKTIENFTPKPRKVFGTKIATSPRIQKPVVIPSPTPGYSMTPLHDFIPTEVVAYHQNKGS